MAGQGAKVESSAPFHRSATRRVKDLGRWPRAACLLLFAPCLLPLALTARAHEPITTKVRFNKEVIRILQRSCLGCHRPGGIAMSLATYEEARPWAKAIKEEILEKRMPPWHAVKGYGEFRNAPPLAQRDVDLIVNWVEGGAPKGEDKDLPAGPLFTDDWPLGKPDMILKPESETKVSPDADDYRIFNLPAALKEDRWVAAIDLRPASGQVVHCATFYLVEAGRREKTDSKVGAQEFAGAIKPPSDYHPSPAAPGPLLGTWMPGQKPPLLPEGVARLLPAGSQIAVRIHYRGAGEGAKDLSAVGLYFAKAPPRRQLQEIGVANSGVLIPAGARLFQVAAAFTIKEDAEAFAVRPAAHPLMVSLQATAYRPDGTQEVLIWSRGYQSDWQPTYYFKQPVALPAATRVEVIAYFDNSDDNRNNPDSPAKPVRWSDLTSDPMCALLIANGRGAND
jgi:hypothetical protein